MSTTTTRLSLYKPAGDESYSRTTDLNNNWDIVDDATRYDQNETITGDWDIENGSPNFTLHNTTDEDADYGRESEIRWKGNQSGAEETTLGLIQIAHDGAADDQKGIFTLSLNDGADGDAPTPVVTVDSAGQMGIGTVTPGAGSFTPILEVYRNGVDTEIMIHEDAGTNESRLHLRSGSNDWEIINYGSIERLGIENESSELFSILPGGNVGINTAGPDRKLDVLDASNPQIRVTHTDGTHYAEFQADGSGDLTITCSGDEVKIPEIVIHGTAANGMITQADGFVSLTGTARAMMDIPFSVVRLKQGGVSDPAQTIVGITYTLGFDATADEEVFLTTVIPHDYDEGTDFKAHYHWAPSDGNAGDVTWGIEYQIMRPESNHVLTAASTTLIVVDATQSLQDECLKSGDITLDGTGIEKGDILHARIFRDANASEGGASDTYAVDANLYGFDIEYMVDGYGEDSQW